MNLKHIKHILLKRWITTLRKCNYEWTKTGIKPDIVGKSAVEIAELAGIPVPENTKLIIAEISGVGSDYPLSREKLSPVLALVKAQSTKQAFQICEDTLHFGGLGHTAVIHTEDETLQKILD